MDWVQRPSHAAAERLGNLQHPEHVSRCSGNLHVLSCSYMLNQSPTPFDSNIFIALVSRIVLVLQLFRCHASRKTSVGTDMLWVFAVPGLSDGGGKDHDRMAR